MFYNAILFVSHTQWQSFSSCPDTDQNMQTSTSVIYNWIRLRLLECRSVSWRLTDVDVSPVDPSPGGTWVATLTCQCWTSRIILWSCNFPTAIPQAICRFNSNLFISETLTNFAGSNESESPLRRLASDEPDCDWESMSDTVDGACSSTSIALMTYVLSMTNLELQRTQNLQILFENTQLSSGFLEKKSNCILTDDSRREKRPRARTAAGGA